ncbi:MAG TPA: GatB/YqeY domain-containing protein [Clostridiales bacterium]|nr:GatB/YqeY domain-containing protein [Clostridiales bacterium]
MGNKIILELKRDYKESLIEKDSIRVGLIQMIRGNIQNFARDNKLTEDSISEKDIYTIMSKELRQQRDSLEAFKKANREDLINETEIKIMILESYLPKQLTESEI